MESRRSWKAAKLGVGLIESVSSLEIVRIIVDELYRFECIGGIKLTVEQTVCGGSDTIDGHPASLRIECSRRIGTRP